ncbi:MAG: hypothetical protein H0W85_05130 [Methylotenera sp.]|nr:hypothetical protein [Methylotenera sp.]
MQLPTNIYKDLWLERGKTLPHPHAILLVSAHWQTHSTKACLVANPEIIHDLGGFQKSIRSEVPGN